MGILSDITVYTKYSKFNKELGRRENWSEIVGRYLQMMTDKFPELKEDIDRYGSFIYSKDILPSMRALQFAGKAIEKTNSRLFNCAYTVIDCSDVFGEIMFLLLGGSGVGFSVQERHISKLPVITKQDYKQRYLITDDIAGWGNAVKTIIKSYFGELDYYPVFDGRDIRPKGDDLSSGGKAPGYEPLKKVLDNLDKILNNAVGRKLTDLEVHDIVCHIANGVLAGGIRRAALISLFDKDSEAMLNCKSGEWWIENEQRGRSNNSAVLHRDFTTKEEFEYVYNKCKDSYSGEPGFAWTNDYDIGFNPLMLAA
jgi:ribonucleoside-diphosphate reductase alpha chain